MFEQPFAPYVPPSKGQTYECLHGDNHLEIYLCVRNAGARSYVSISWDSPRHPEIEEFGRAVVEGALASLPDDPIRISRKTTISRSIASWSIFFVPAEHALDLAERIFPTFKDLWNGWCRAKAANPHNLDMPVLSIVKQHPTELPEWFRPVKTPVNTPQLDG